MPWWVYVLIVLFCILVGLLVFLIIYGKKMQGRQAESQKQMEANKQQVSMLVIDKQKKKLKEAGLPESVMEQAPKYMRLMKIPVVKAKVGNRVMTLIAEDKVFQILPVKKTVTVSISGIYITELRSVRGGQVPKLPEKKKSLVERLREKAAKAANGK